MNESDTASLADIVAGEIRAHLARNRLTGRAAAFELGWTQQYMSRRLTGVVPFDVADLEAIAGLLGVPVTAFFASPGRASPVNAGRSRMLGNKAPSVQVMGLAA